MSKSSAATPKKQTDTYRIATIVYKNGSPINKEDCEYTVDAEVGLTKDEAARISKAGLGASKAALATIAVNKDGTINSNC